MSKSLTLPNFIIANAITMILKGKSTEDAVIKTASAIDKSIDENFVTKSELIQERIVEDILLPLSRELLKENPRQFAIILDTFMNEVRGRLEKEEV